MKKHQYSVVLSLVFVLLLIAAGAGRIIANPSAMAQGAQVVEPQDALAQAWERAREAGSYKFLSTADQTMVPRPIPSMIGKGDVHLTLENDGAVVLPDRAYIEMRVAGMSQSKSVTMLRDGTQAYMVQDGELQPVDDALSLASPSNDVLGYLAAAEQVTLLEPPEGRPDLVRYSFQISGPRFAEYVRQQAQAEVQAQPGAPAGLTLKASPPLQQLSGQGELWVNQEGLPVRQVVDIRMPQVNDEYGVRVQMTVDLSGYGQVERLPQAIQGADGTWRLEGELRTGVTDPGALPEGAMGSGLSAYEAPSTPGIAGSPADTMTAVEGWRALFSSLLPLRVAPSNVALLILIILMILVARYYRRSPRRCYVLIVTLIIPIMVFSSLLAAGQVLVFMERQANAAEKSAAATPELLEAMGLQVETPDEAPAPDDTAPEADQPAQGARPPRIADSLPHSAIQDLDLELDPRKRKDGLAVMEVGSGTFSLQICGYGDPGVDTDNDGLTDQVENCLGTAVTSPDTDGDAITDTIEIVGFDLNGTHWDSDPLNGDSNRDTVADTMEWSEDLVATGKASTADLDEDGVPNLWDDDDDNDGVPDAQDLSRNALSDYTYELNLNTSGSMESGTESIELEIQPRNMDHLRYSTTPLDWPPDEEGNVKDLDDSQEDLRLTPFLLVTTNITPTEMLLEKYGVRAWYDEEQGKTVMLVTLQPLEDGGAIYAWYAKVAYGSDQTADIQWSAKVVWMTQMQNDSYTYNRWGTQNGVAVSTSVLHQYREEFRLTGLQITRNESYEATIVGTPGMPGDDRYLFQAFMGLSSTFTAYERLESQDENETMLQEIADRFAPGYVQSPTLTYDIPSNIVVVPEPVTYLNQEAGTSGVATEMLPAWFRDNPTYGNNARCANSDGTPVVCATLLLATETHSGVQDLSEFAADGSRMASLDQLSVDLGNVPVFAGRNITLRMYERNATTLEWGTMTPARMLEMVEARYHGIYASTLAELYPNLRGEDMRFVAYTCYLWAYGGRLAIVSVDGRALVPEVADEDAIAIQNAVDEAFVDNGLDYMGLASSLPGVMSDVFNMAGGIYQVIDLVTGDVTGNWLKAQGTLTGFAIAATVASLIMNAINTACSVNPDLAMCGNETALLVANILVGTLVIAVQIAAIVISIVEAVVKGLEIIVKNINVAGVVLGFIGAGVGIAMAWVSFGIVMGMNGSDPVAWRMALGMAIVTTVWLIVMACLNFIPVIGPIITAILGVIDFIISLFTGLFTDKTWSLVTIIFEMFYSATTNTCLASAEFGDFHTELIDADMGMVGGNVFRLYVGASGVITKTEDGTTGDLERSYVEGQLETKLVAGGFHGQDVSDDRDCDVVDGELHCENVAALGYALQPRINGVASFVAKVLYQTVWAEYMFWGTVRVNTHETTGTLPEDPEVNNLYLDVLPASLDDLWHWSEITNYDVDGDGLTADQESALGTSDSDWDSDDDGLSDKYEWETGSERGCDPLDPDSDDDGLNDALERRLGTRINLADSDGDDLRDGEEVRHWKQYDWDPCEGAIGDLVGGWQITPPPPPGGGQVSALEVSSMWVSSNPLKGDDDGDTLNAWEEQTNGISPQALNNLVPTLKIEVSPVTDIPDARPGMFWLPGTEVSIDIDMENWAYAPVTTTLSLILPSCFDTIAGGVMEGDRSIPMTQSGNTVSWAFTKENPLQLYEGVSMNVTARVRPDTTSYQGKIAAEMLYGEVQMHKPVQVTVDGDDPVLAIMSPADGAYLRGRSYVVGGSAYDPTTWIAERKLSIVTHGGDDSYQTLPLGQGAWAYTWSDITDGTYDIELQATDGMQHTATTAPVVVVVDNVVPQVSLNWAMDSGVVALSGSATDDRSGVAWVQISVDNQPWFNIPFASDAWSYDWAVGASAQGEHEAMVRAGDRSGNRSAVASAEIVVDRVAPSSIVNQGADAALPPVVQPNTAFDLAGVADEGGHLPLPLSPAPLTDGMDVFDDSAIWLGLSSIHDNDGGVLAAWAGDLNADRFSDLVVGLPGPEGAQGEVAVVYGRAGGWPVQPDLAMLERAQTHLTGASGARLGSYVAAAGDVNGDSTSDLLVGERESSRAFLIYGGANYMTSGVLDAGQSGYRTLLNAPATVEGLAAAGDVNGDGWGDILIRAGGTAYLVAGRANPWPETLDVADQPLASFSGVTGALGVGDVDQDQLDEWVILANGSITRYGWNTGGNTVETGTAYASTDTAPRAVAVGDMDGDGKADWIYSSGADHILVYGSGATPHIFGNYGGMLAAPGDVDADGRPDLLLVDAAGLATLVRYQEGESAPEAFATINGVGGAANAPYAAGGDLNSNGSSDLVLIPSEAAAEARGFDAPSFESGFVSPQALPRGVSSVNVAAESPRRLGVRTLASGTPDNYYVDDDNVCDGQTPCYTTIQAAVNVADGGGDTITVYPGAYGAFSVAAGATHDGLTIAGVSADAVFVDGAGSNAITILADGVNLRNLTVRNAVRGVAVGNDAGELPLGGANDTSIDHLVAHSVQNSIAISESAVLSVADSTLVGDGAHPIIRAEGLDANAHVWSQDQTMASAMGDNGGLVGTDTTLYAMPGGTDRTVYAATPGTGGALGAWSAAFQAPHPMPEEAGKSVLAAGGGSFFQMHSYYKAPDLGATDGEVKAVAVAANGDIYAGGNFGQIGGVNAMNIARWDAATGTWNPLGSATSNGVAKEGGSATVWALTIVSNGDVYVGGHFNRARNAGVETPAQNIVRWSGGQWVTLGEAVVNESGVYGNGVSGDASDGLPEADVAVYALAHTDDDVVIVGGRFRHFHEALSRFLAGEGHTHNIAYYHPTRWLNAEGIGDTWFMFINGDVGNNAESIRSLYWAGGTFQPGTHYPFPPAGIMYAGGSFTHAGLYTTNHVARFQWDSASGTWAHWQPLGSIATSVSDVTYNATNGKVYAVSDDAASAGVYEFNSSTYTWTALPTATGLPEWDSSTKTWNWAALPSATGAGSAVGMDGFGNVYAGMVDGRMVVVPLGATAAQVVGSETTRIWDLARESNGQMLAARGAALDSGLGRWVSAGAERRNLSAGTWTMIAAPGAMNGAQTPLIAADDAGNLYATWNEVQVIEGTSSEWQHAHLYALPAGSTTWQDRGTSPAGQHSIFRELVVNGSRLYVFSGYVDEGGSGYVNQFYGTWIYDLATQTWSWGDVVNQTALATESSPNLVSIAADGVGHVFILGPALYDWNYVFSRYDVDSDWHAATKPTILDTSEPSALARVGHYLYAYATPAGGATSNILRYGELGYEQRVQANRNVYVLPDTATSGAWRTADNYRLVMSISAADSDWVAKSGASLNPAPGETPYTSAQAAFVDPTNGNYRLSATSQLSAGYHDYVAVAHIYPSQAACALCGSGGIAWDSNAFDTVREGVESGAARVLVHPGQYPQSFYLVSGVEVMGSGAENTIIQPPAGAAATLVTAEGVAGSSVSRLTLAGGASWDGFLAEGGATGLVLSRLIIRDLDTGIRLRGGSTVEIVNNTLARNGDGLVAEGSNPLNVRNTLFAYNTGTGITRGTSSSLSVTYNGFWGNGTDMSNAEGAQASVFENPLFRNLAGNDLRLAEGSPMIDMGAPSDPTTPGGGERVDIGYAEYNTAGFYVSKDYSDVGLNDGLTWGVDAFDQIQPALDAAASTMHDLRGAIPEGGYSVGVDAGTYAERVTVPSHVRLVGSGPIVTAIDAAGGGSAVTFSGVIDSEISGFTLLGGAGTNAGVRLGNASSGIAIRRNVIRGNGYGVYLDGAATAEIEFNTIVNNTASGVYASGLGSRAETSNNIIANNQAGLHIASDGMVRNDYNLLYGNTSATIDVAAGPNTVTGDPALGASYVPTAASPAIDAADPLAAVPLAGGTRADLGYKELIASPLTVLLGPDKDATVTGNAGVAMVEVGVVAVSDPATQSAMDTLPTAWSTLTPSTDDEPLFYWSQSVTQADAGFYRVYSRASDAVGNVEEKESDWYEGAFVVDNTAPTITWVTAPPSSTDQAAVLVEVDVAGTVSTGAATRDDVAHVYYSATGPLGTATYPAADGRAWIMLPEQGSYTLEAVAVDEAGNEARSSVSFAASAMISGQVASVATVIDPPAGLTSTTVTLHGAARFAYPNPGNRVDIKYGTTTIYATLDTLEVAFTAWSATITLPAGEGTTTVTVEPGGPTARLSTTLGLTVDTTAPTLAITTPAEGATVVQSAAWTGSASDAGSGLARVEVSMDGGYTWRQAALSGNAWSMDWEMAEYQDYVSYPARVRAIDAAGNTVVIARPVTVDNVAPADPAPLTFDPQVGQHVDQGTTLTISWPTPVDPSGTVQVLVAVDQSAETVPTTVASGTSYTSAGLTKGDWYAHLAVVDAAGNQSVEHYGPWHVRYLPTGLYYPNGRHSIIRDGLIDLEHDEWREMDLLGIDARSGNPQAFYVASDHLYIYMGWSGAWWTLDGVLWAYLNVVDGGTTTMVDGNPVPGGFPADLAVQISGPDEGVLWTWNGSAWVEGTLDYANGPSGDTEVRVSWLPHFNRPLNVVAFALPREAEQAAGGGMMALAGDAAAQELPVIVPWAAFPASNPLTNLTEDYEWPSLTIHDTTDPNSIQPTIRTVFMEVTSPQAAGVAQCAGTDIVYDIALENPEPDEISGLTLALVASSGLSYQSVTGATLASGAAGEANWTLDVPALAGGATAHVIVTARTASSLSGLAEVSSSITLAAGTTILTPESNASATMTHRVDGAAPTVAIDVLGGSAIKPDAAGNYTFTGTASDGGTSTGQGSGVASVGVLGGALATGTMVWSVSVDIPDSGQFTLEVQATDGCNQTSATATQIFNVDSTAPSVNWIAPAVVTEELATISGAAVDETPVGGLVKSVEVQVDDSATSKWFAVDGLGAPKNGVQPWRWTWITEPEDGVRHYLRVRAADEAGNVTVTNWQESVVDVVAPQVVVSAQLGSVTLPNDPPLGGGASTKVTYGWITLVPGIDVGAEAPVTVLAATQLLAGTVTDGAGVQAVKVLVYGPQGASFTGAATLDNGNWEYAPEIAGWAAGTYALRVQAVDIHGNTSMMGPYALKVADAPIAGLAASNDGPKMIGMDVTLSALVSGGSNVVYSWDFGDESEPIEGWQVTHAYATDGEYIATVTASNSAGTTTAQTTVTILALSVEAGPDKMADEGTTVPVESTFTDNRADELHTATIDWGDGTTPTEGAVDEALDTIAGSHAYADNGTYVVTVSVTDEDGVTASGTLQVMVSNVAPTAVLGNDGPKDEGSVVTVSFSNVSDAGAADTSFTYSFDWDNDGVYDIADQAAPSAQHTWPDDGIYTVSGMVKDDDGGYSEYSTVVTVNNVAPTIALSGAANVDEGYVSYTLTLGQVTDPGADVVTTWLVQWGDGESDSFSSGGEKMHVYADGPSVPTTTVDLTDEDGVFAAAGTLPVTVNNVAPTIELSGASNVNEGSSYALTLGDITDPGVDTVTAWIVNWGDGTADSYTAGGEVTHTYADGLSNPSITVDLTDEDGAFVGAGSKDVTVNNVAPAIALSGVDSVDEGASYELTLGQITDPGADTVSQWQVNWGDGLSDTYTSDGVKTHVYADGPSVPKITVDLTDEDGTFVAAGSKTIAVNNVAPTTDAGPDATLNEGETFASSGSFTDPGADTWTATVDYGDDTGLQDLALNLDKTFALSHVYADDDADDQYTVTVCVADDDLGNDCDTAMVTVLNVAPVVTAAPETQTVQYSEAIAAITWTATDVAADSMTAALRWSADGGATFTAGDPADLALGAASCDSSGGVNNVCTWQVAGNVLLPAGTYTLRLTVTDKDGGATDKDVTLVVQPEEASVEFDGDNPVAVKVATEGGNSGLFSLRVCVSETDATVPGDISLAQVSMTLAPVGPGTPVSGMASEPSVADGEQCVTFGFDGVAVNTYTVQVTVGGGYYIGSGEDVLTVYDPSLGFTTGGGWFYWPESASEDGSYPGDRTNFGYTMKYNKKGENVQGSLLMIRHMADGTIYRVKSNALYGLALGESATPTMGWASFSGKATYQEPGWAEPIGNYEFKVYVEDRNEPGVGVDRFWIEVLDGLSLPREAIDEAVPLSGGNIVAPHKPGNDTEPPVVTISSPVNGATVNGTLVSITADASSTVGVTQVEFLVDGASLGVDADGGDGWTATWDLAGVADGAHTIEAVATATDGQTGSDSISVTVDNAVDVAITVGSLAGSSAWTKVGVTWQATVLVKVDPALGGAVVTGAWSTGATGTCTTDTNGTCTIVLGGLSKKVASATFTVNDIALAGYEYVPGSITSVTVSKP